MPRYQICLNVHMFIPPPPHPPETWLVLFWGHIFWQHLCFFFWGKGRKGTFITVCQHQSLFFFLWISVFSDLKSMTMTKKLVVGGVTVWWLLVTVWWLKSQNCLKLSLNKLQNVPFSYSAFLHGLLLTALHKLEVPSVGHP